MLLDVLRDGLADDELTTDELSRRELTLDKALIQLIQVACKEDRPARALDVARLLHHVASFDMAVKVAGFYHLIGLQEKIRALKDDREDDDRLFTARDRRRERASDFAAIPALRAPLEPAKAKTTPFQDFRPPPTVHRPGLERATPAAAEPLRTFGLARTDEFQSSAADLTEDYAYEFMPDGKRKRSKEPGQAPASLDGGAKRRAVDAGQTSESSPNSIGRQNSDIVLLTLGSNPFARKAAPGTDNRNPFNRNAEMNKSLHKSESFFNKVDAAELEAPKRERLADAPCNHGLTRVSFLQA